MIQTVPRPLLIVPTATRETLTCPSCARPIGQFIGPLFVMQTRVHHGVRRLVGPPPAFIVCEHCGGIWCNSAWDFADAPEHIWRQIQALPYGG